jgi:hypothetical protein
MTPDTTYLVSSLSERMDLEKRVVLDTRFFDFTF